MSLDTDRVILTPIRQNRGTTSVGTRGHHHQNEQENFEDLRSHRPDGQAYPEEDMRSMIHNLDNEEFKEEGIRGLKHDRSLGDELTERSVLGPASFKIPKNAEEFVVPALGLKKPIDFNTVGDDDFNQGVVGLSPD